MTKDALEICGPVFELIRQMQNATNEDEKAHLENRLYEVCEKSYTELKTFNDNFKEIQNKNLDLEERIMLLNDLLDRQMLSMSLLDEEDSRHSCEIIYSSFWDKLNQYSQRYLIMANYLFKLFNTNSTTDFSPSVLEFGRAIENELLSKIYREYVEDISERTYEMVDLTERYTSLRKAVRRYTYNDPYYIPAREMIRYLSYLKILRHTNDYNEALRTFLKDRDIDIDQLSDQAFTTSADEIFDRYRNPAAHPGGQMSSSDATTCREKSKKVLKQFMRAIP